MAQIEKDEREWFPYCLALGRQWATAVFMEDEECLGDVAADEENAEALLADLKSIMIKHLSGEYNENLCYAVLFAISSLEKDMKQHNRIRYRIVQPMIRQMERFNLKK